MNSEQVGRKYGFRSGLEEQVGAELRAAGVDYTFEEKVIEYAVHKVCKYTPDFVLPNGIILETKGRFTTDDRMKHRAIREQFPELDIRFIFTNPNARISKRSNTTYAMWCERYGFQFAKAATKAQLAKGASSIPAEWLAEGGSPADG